MERETVFDLCPMILPQSLDSSGSCATILVNFTSHKGQ